MTTYGYIRVSTAEQVNGGDSIETQRQQVLGYAMMRGMAMGEVFVEGGVSGSVPIAERPEGARLLSAINPGDAIVVAKLDRMFRSASDALGTLESMKAKGVSLHMIDLGGDVTGNGISKLVFTILSAVAENERDRIRERIRDVKRHLAKSGAYAGGRVPFGYSIDGDKVKLAPEGQRMLTHMLTSRKSGTSYRAIAKSLSEEFGQPQLAPMSIKRIIEREERTCA